MKCCTCRSGGRFFPQRSAAGRDGTVRCLSGRGLPADHERVPGGGEGDRENRKSVPDVRRARMNRLLSEEGGEVEIREVE